MMEDGLDACCCRPGRTGCCGRWGSTTLCCWRRRRASASCSCFCGCAAGWPRLHRAGNWLAGGAVAFVVGYAGLLPWAVRHSLPAVEVLNGGREVLMVLVFGYGWVVLLCAAADTGAGGGWRRYYALTYFFFFVGYVHFLAQSPGPDQLQPHLPQCPGLGADLELLMLSALLTGRFRHTLRQNAQLRVQHLRQRNAQGARLIAAQDDEREQLARELHDALGPNLRPCTWPGRARPCAHALASAPAAAAAGQHAEICCASSATRCANQPRPAARRARSLTASPTPFPRCAICSTCTARRRCTPIATPASISCRRPVQSGRLPHRGRAAEQCRAPRPGPAGAGALRRLPTALELCVDDDGRGFGRGEDTPLTGIGLRGVRTRAAYLGGSVSIEVPKVGTRVVVRLPC